MPQLVHFDLSKNEFTGQLPKYGRKQLPKLRSLFLEDNQLTGPIPKKWIALTSLEVVDAGYNTSVIAFDYAQAAVDRARELLGSQQRDMVELLCADATDLPIPTASIDATLDKGTLDAIFIAGTDMFYDSVRELGRVTAPSGVVVCISRVVPPETLLAAFGDATDLVRMHGLSALTLNLSKRRNANLLTTVEAAKDVVASHQLEWPENVKLDVVFDQSDQVRKMVSDLESNVFAAAGSMKNAR